MVRWWRQWRRYGILPYGHASIIDEPAFVFDAIDAAETSFCEVEHELAQRPVGDGHG